ncbi:SOS response-associated peptidase [Stieleria varia]|uniref:SOS response-associated peptidase n=1 Tax=Stieleria varia TaxID=2528005 RepID=UPI001E3A0FF4|nr:SOS response-associated peptidase [Stieleria varia]
MCGRFTLRTNPVVWGQLFLPGWSADEIKQRAEALGLKPRFNIAPTQSIACIHRSEIGGPRQLTLFRWGLLPPWADDLAIGAKMINARSETLDQKRSFQSAFASQRCLVPMDGYYEWSVRNGAKQPFLIEPSSSEPLVMAGLWQLNKKLGRDGEPVFSVTVITTAANKTTQSIHDRMPVFLPESAHDQWLDPGFADTDTLTQWLVPAPDDLLVARPVAKTVGSVRIDDERCVQPATPDDTPRQGLLFDD